MYRSYVPLEGFRSVIYVQRLSSPKCSAKARPRPKRGSKRGSKLDTYKNHIDVRFAEGLENWGEDGRRHRMWVFVLVLGFSLAIYVEFLGAACTTTKPQRRASRTEAATSCLGTEIVLFHFGPVFSAMGYRLASTRRWTRAGLRRVDIQNFSVCQHTISVVEDMLRRCCSPVIRAGFTTGRACRQSLPVTERHPSA